MSQKRRKKTGQKVSQPVTLAKELEPAVLPVHEERACEDTEKQGDINNHGGDSRGGYDDGYDDENIAKPVREKKLSKPQTGQKKAFDAECVRKSTLYMGIATAFIVGFFMGTLLPSAVNEGTRHGAVSGGSGVPMQAEHSVPPASVPPSEADNSTVAATGHILALEEAVRKNPKDVAAWIQLGNQYFDIQKPNAAIHAYEHALGIQPDNANVLTDLGIMYRAIGQFEKAVQMFSKASDIDAKHEHALFNTGIVLYYDLGRKVEGRQAWEKLLRMNPEVRVPSGMLLKEMLNDIE